MSKGRGGGGLFRHHDGDVLGALHHIGADGAIYSLLHGVEPPGAHHDLLHAMAGGVVHNGSTAVKATLGNSRDLALALELLPLLLARLQNVEAILRARLHMRGNAHGACYRIIS